MSGGWDRAVALAAESAASIGRMIDDLSRIGGSGNGMVSRPGFTQEERQAHNVASEWLSAAGFVTTVDSFGNTIASLEGTVEGVPIAIGSHLDSVFHGGRFDGTAGVVAAIELARILHSAHVRPRHGLRVIIFANEEGARFGEPCLGSKAVTGELSPEDADRLRDGEGISLASAMEALGFDAGRIPEARWTPRTISAFLELHIEQARVLEDLGRPIGLVDVVAGSVRLLAKVVGRPDHSGGTPMDARRDALAGSAEMISLVEREGLRAPSGARATVGKLHVHPNGITTIPGRVTFYVDIRDIDARRLSETVGAIERGIVEIAARRGLKADVERIARTAPTHLWIWLRNVLRTACEEADLPWHVLPSGAGHDAQVIARHFPAAMVFVPSHDGSSHVPEEWTEPDQVAAGVQVLIRAIRRLDGTSA